MNVDYWVYVDVIRISMSSQPCSSMSYYCRKSWYDTKFIGNLALVFTDIIESKSISRLKNCESKLFYYQFNNQNIDFRSFHIGTKWNGQEASSKVEETVKNIKEEKENQKLKTISTTIIFKDQEKGLEKKPTRWQKIKIELLHYYHGFRLLGLDMKVSAKLIWRILKGHELSRREHRLLIKTTGDMFRLIPFSVFIIVPFMEFLLPIVIKIFPGLLPSTFQTATEKEDKLKQALKVKIEMAKFLQKTLDEMAVQSSDHRSEKAKEFADFFYKVRTTGTVATNEEIMKFSKLFEDEITLDSLSRQQLIALCRVLDVQTLGTTNFLRFLLRMKLRSLAADDKLIEKEGVNTLTRAELQQACRARGMRAYGMPEQRLRDQLFQWLDLSLTKKVPPSLLLLSRALMVPETIPMSDKLKATISALPDSVVTCTKGAIGEKEGKLDHKTNIEIIKIEEKKIEEERQEEKEIKQKEKKENGIKPQTIEVGLLLNDDKITTKDVKVLEQALDSIGKDKKKMSVEKEELKELKEEMAEYQEDIQELNQLKIEAKGLTNIDTIKVSKGAKRLFTKVNKMISKMDAVLLELEQSEKRIKEEINALPSEKKSDLEVTAELVRIDELIAAIKQIQNVPDNHRLTRITEILGKIDDDRDGAIKIEDVLKVIELIGKEDIKLSKNQLNELIELMEKEEVLEVEGQIQKALKKESEKLKNDKQEEIFGRDKSSSNSTVPFTSIEIRTQANNIDVNTNTNTNKNFVQSSTIDKKKSDNSTILKNSKSINKTSIGSNVPSTPKKAKDSKQL
ncbi:PREDICTED: LETM1 and EF-hand domain-containing protein anon-60Da, mitochondrial [Ceratosolen solmsi marchali]|uniref:Mitochondrial proton/calcium exchanger protein n=1 Tax=Ceratosolen solmsi marchali TaxID=326594 RepID=A0AAJ6YDP0_9HYME|nr:PREDICTED: LETM1 and EF-hand domain-containing protein anon-60Da, mitochondrial [Ceratosolen solmsi marchali]